MNCQLMSSSPCLSLVCFLLVILLKVQSSSSDPYLESLSCRPQFECGHITASYPFWGVPWSWSEPACGHPDFLLYCEGDHHNQTTMMINYVKYGVLDTNPTAQTLKIAILMSQSFAKTCIEFASTTFNSELFYYSSPTENENVILNYNCLPYTFDNAKPNCQINGVKYKDGFVEADDAKHEQEGCNTTVSVPVPKSLLRTTMANWSDWKNVLQKGFELNWKKLGGVACEDCTSSKGICGFDHETICYCPNTAQLIFHETCPYNSPNQTRQAPPVFARKKKHPSHGLVIGVVVGGIAAIVLVGFLIFCFIRKRRTTAAPTSMGTSTTTTTSQSQFIKTDIERGAKSTYLGVKVFDYTELEQATDNFNSSKELGDGGFGIVYYGVLKDGRTVAVKRLYEKNIKRVEQFMNEIGILTTLRHPNLVNLYGCTSRHSRELLLVYEYIPNGTVADHIHARNSKSGLLPWSDRLSIAVQTAGALFYLHSSEVIHRDVKTNNILLDNNFQVKVADFGLSRLFPTDVTHVSTTPQGTPGYVDPEYRQCYHLTDKSDVYSFGVVLIELISSLEAVDTNRHRHDINLANMAINKIQNHALSELVDPSLGFEKDYAVRSTVTSVAELAFRCLQLDRDMRPAMQEVLEVLEGIQNEQFGELKAEVVDISTDNAALSKSAPPSISPDSARNDKWVSHSLPPNSF